MRDISFEDKHTFHLALLAVKQTNANCTFYDGIACPWLRANVWSTLNIELCDTDFIALDTVLLIIELKWLFSWKIKNMLSSFSRLGF